ncbi:hypothetical protein ACJX0J_012551, partial [Zea mays]
MKHYGLMLLRFGFNEKIGIFWKNDDGLIHANAEGFCQWPTGWASEWFYGEAYHYGDEQAQRFKRQMMNVMRDTTLLEIDRLIANGALLLEENSSRFSCESEALNMTIKAGAEKNLKLKVAERYDTFLTFVFIQISHYVSHY